LLLQDDIEKVMEEQERLKTQLSKVNTRTKELAAQNERMQTMVCWSCLDFPVPPACIYHINMP